jgi:hypothetical protein
LKAGECACHNKGKLMLKNHIYRFVADQLSVDDLERDRKSEINVERFIGNTHRPAAELDRCSIGVLRIW